MFALLFPTVTWIEEGGRRKKETRIGKTEGNFKFRLAA